jgi:hypothetical protein
MARTRGCLDYRAVLRTSFLHESKQGINLFSLLVTTLLRDIEMPTGAVSPPTFGVEWDAIEAGGTDISKICARTHLKLTTQKS